MRDCAELVCFKYTYLRSYFPKQVAAMFAQGPEQMQECQRPFAGFIWTIIKAGERFGNVSNPDEACELLSGQGKRLLCRDGCRLGGMNELIPQGSASARHPSRADSVSLFDAFPSRSCRFGGEHQALRRATDSVRAPDTVSLRHGANDR